MLDEAAFRLATSPRRLLPQSGNLARARLARPFPRWARHRVLLIYHVHPLAEVQFLPFFRYARRFARRGIAFRAVPFEAADNPESQPPGATALFVQAPYDYPRPLLQLLHLNLRDAYPDASISFFDWAAPLDLRFAETVAGLVDHYVKKAVMRDSGYYRRPRIGHTNLTEHYAERFGTDNPPRDWEEHHVVGRLALSPAFSTGSSLIARFERGAPPTGKRPIDLHARIAVNGTPWYQAMRAEARDVVTRAFGDLRVAADGFVSPRKYVRELAMSKICFSPFGYGEICWRDFEAAALGAVLLKPDMSHLAASPDIYVPFETYVPVKWDLSDVDERVRALLADDAERRRLAENAFAAVHTHAHGDALDRLLDHLLARAPASSSASERLDLITEP